MQRPASIAPQTLPRSQHLHTAVWRNAQRRHRRPLALPWMHVTGFLALDRPLLPKVRNRLHSRERLQGLLVAGRPRIAKLHIEWDADECNPWVVWLRLGEGVLGARGRARLASCPPLECLRCMGWHLVRAAVLWPELEDHLGRSKGEHHWRSRRRPRAKRCSRRSHRCRNAYRDRCCRWRRILRRLGRQAA